MRREDLKDYPLTYKWYAFIRGICSNVGKNLIAIDEAYQEAMILEWQLTKKIQDLTYRENYFKKVIYRKLYSIKNDWWNRSRIVIREDSAVSEEMFMDNIVQIRPFDKIYTEELIFHIATVLREIDSVCSEMFLIRIYEREKWKKIKEIYYNELPHNKYYDKIKLIKNIVKKELCYV